MRVVLEEVERYDEDRAGLIMTLDRTKGPEIWQECLEVALKLKKEGRRLLGVDLAGDPLKADVSIFQSFFAEAREAGLGITLHIAEVCRSRPYLLYRPIFNCFALDACQYG
jgi:adenosine deaminase